MTLYDRTLSDLVSMTAKVNIIALDKALGYATVRQPYAARVKNIKDVAYAVSHAVRGLDRCCRTERQRASR